jgi:hypothetical protein
MREQKQLKTRGTGAINRYWSSANQQIWKQNTKPTKEQVIKLAALLDIDYETIMITWLKEKLSMKLVRKIYYKHYLKRRKK